MISNGFSIISGHFGFWPTVKPKMTVLQISPLKKMDIGDSFWSLLDLTKHRSSGFCVCIASLNLLRLRVGPRIMPTFPEEIRFP